MKQEMVDIGSSSTDDPNATVPQRSFAPATEAAGPPSGSPGGAGAEEGLRYRILGPLGEGGMGVVYRAEDTRLGRTVAVKTVPAALTANPRAKQRFLNEARAASALDHPNVCTVYDIEEAGQVYLTMPCYDGETLKSRLERGPLPVAEALDVIRQVARGLAKAHRLGIVHCDIKPANLMLTADGIVKILDFGIARLLGETPAVPGGPSGTRGYRSPEQARGEEVDAASDVWSLGIVLQEMVTGRKPQDEPQEEMIPLPENAPPRLACILSRMLAWRPGDRYPDAAALLADLDRLADEIDGRAARWRGAGLRRRLWAAALGLMLALALLGVFAIGRGASPSREGPAASLPHTTAPALYQVTDFLERTSSPSLSPDGKTVVYARSVEGRSHLFFQPTIRGAEALDLSARSPADDTQPSFSPDGRWIAFRSERDGGGIFLMPAQGGPVRRLTDFGFHPAWSPDGKEIACSTASIESPQVRRTSSEVFRVDIATGARRRVTRGDAAQPSWSPHGNRVAYWGLVPQTGRRTIWTVPAEGGEALPAVDDDSLNWSPVWSPDGRYLYFASDRSGIMNLWRVPIDEESGRVTGGAEPVTASQQACMLPSLARDGRQIAYASDGSRATLDKIGFDPARGRVVGPAVTVVQTSSVINDCSASPDGNWLVCQLLTPREELFVVHPDGSGWRRLICDENRNRRPQFSPDGSRIAFYSNRGGKYEIWTIGLDGRRLVQETSLPGKFVSTPLWSPDGRTLACEVAGREALLDLTRPVGERIPQYLESPDRAADFIAYSWSSDGRWLAGARQHRDGSHDPGVLLYSLEEKKYIWLPNRGDSPLWLHDSHRLLYTEGNGFLLFDMRSGSSAPILSAPPGSTYRSFSLSPDDRGLYLARTIHEGHIWLLKLGSLHAGGHTGEVGQSSRSLHVHGE
jgi:Tol biopolymer transport system component